MEFTSIVHYHYPFTRLTANATVNEMKDKYNLGSMKYHHAQHIQDLELKCRLLSFPADAKRLATLLSDLHFYLEAFGLKDSDLYRQLDRWYPSLKHIPESNVVFERMKEFVGLHSRMIELQLRLKIS